MVEEGFRDEDWMDIPHEEGLNVISPPRIMNILSALAILTMGVEGDEITIPKVRCTGPRLQAESVTSTSVPSQPTNLLPSCIRCRLINADLERIRTIYGIPDEYQLRLAN